MTPWNPPCYLKFVAERSRPAYDLVARIGLDRPTRIADIGCGPGNSTQALRERWPDSEIVGVDDSAEMIRNAAETYPAGQWICADAAEWRPGVRYQVVFSNAALQWIPDHPRLFGRLFDLVDAGGVLAVQVPANQETPLHRSLLRVSAREPWRDAMRGCGALLTYRDARFYYDLLAPRAKRLDMWQTTYYHVLPSHQGLIDWSSSTSMRPYLDRLGGEEERARFREEVLAGCVQDYPAQADGAILFPFPRLFMIACKPPG
jgi:trans-aconitate 2-methyltransferase